MGGERERSVTGTAASWQEAGVAPFNTVAVDCIAGADALIQPTIPGLPDDAFLRDGNLTKREIRAATLAVLAPIPGRSVCRCASGSAR